MTITFLSLEDVIDIHDDILKVYGGLQGLREIGMLESALKRIDFHRNYTDLTNLFETAALLAKPSKKILRREKTLLRMTSILSTV